MDNIHQHGLSKRRQTGRKEKCWRYFDEMLKVFEEDANLNEDAKICKSSTSMDFVYKCSRTILFIYSKKA